MPLSDIVATRTWFTFMPSGSASIRRRLRTNRPVPTSSTTVSDACTNNRDRRVYRRVDPLDAREQHTPYELTPPARDQHRRPAPERGEDEALEHEQSQQPTTSDTERQPDRDLAAAPYAARE